jgi:hypothetical protein
MHDLSKPQSGESRAFQERLGREPRVTYEEGFGMTIDFYAAHRAPEQVRADLNRLLTER